MDRWKWLALGAGALALMPANDSTALAKNFTVREFQSHDGIPVPIALLPNLRTLAVELQKIRDRVGSPIVVLSGFRSLAHNESVGGAVGSQHLFARAADIRAPQYAGGDERALHSLILGMIRAKQLREGGVGLYVRSGAAGWVHYDVRGTAARWNG